MLNTLKEKNKNIEFFTVNDPEFAKYGRVIKGFDISEIIAECEKMPYPDEGSKYEAGVESLEKLAIAEKIKNEVYGEMDTQIGACYGHSTTLNGLEFHKGSEVNIAVTDFVLILGTTFEMKDGKFNSADAKAFYVKKGEMIEVYASTLHFCPCQVSDDGFFCVVGLPKGTNLPLDGKYNDKLLFRKNKWLIAHEDNKALIERGVASGIYGENYTIKY